MVHFLSLSRSYGFSHAIKAELETPDKDLLGVCEDMKREQTLLAYAPSCDVNELMPGLPTVHTGFWVTPAPSEWKPSRELEAFLAAGAPVCLNFGSMQVAVPELGGSRGVLPLHQRLTQQSRRTARGRYQPCGPHACLLVPWPSLLLL